MGHDSTVRPLVIAGALALGLMVGGCFTQTYQRGYVLADGALEQIPLGAPQEQVLISLGTPSTVATVSGEVFYYISSKTEQTSFMPEKVVDQRVTRAGLRARARPAMITAQQGPTKSPG